jgi:2,3-bisphosphoglycerate-independent phosphoglycerate mutase
MVAHTGKFSATVEAIETVDKYLTDVIDAAESMNGICVVTSDHGHAEEMLDCKTGEPRTAHTLNPVPFFITSSKVCTLRTGRLADVAPTVLHILGFKKPIEMIGTTLITSN